VLFSFFVSSIFLFSYFLQSLLSFLLFAFLYLLICTFFSMAASSFSSDLVLVNT
jgi:hypothetical protein